MRTITLRFNHYDIYDGEDAVIEFDVPRDWLMLQLDITTDEEVVDFMLEHSNEDIRMILYIALLHKMILSVFREEL